MYYVPTSRHTGDENNVNCVLTYPDGHRPILVPYWLRAPYFFVSAELVLQKEGNKQIAKKKKKKKKWNHVWFNYHITRHLQLFLGAIGTYMDNGYWTI